MAPSIFDPREEDEERTPGFLLESQVTEEPREGIGRSIFDPIETTEEPSEGISRSIFDPIETPGEVDILTPPPRKLPSLISGPAQVAPSTAQPKTAVDIAREEMRPGHVDTDWQKTFLYGRGGSLSSFLQDPIGWERIKRHAIAAKRLSEVGTAAMSAIPGIGWLTGQEYRGILPDLPKDMPMRWLLETGKKYLAEPVIGAGVAIMGGIGMIFSPVSGAISEPATVLFGEIGETVAGKKGRWWGEQAGQVSGALGEVFIGFGVGKVLTQAGKTITVQQLGRFIGGGAKEPTGELAVLNLADNVSPTLPKEPFLIKKAVDILGGVPWVGKRLEKLRKAPQYGPTLARKAYLETAPGDEMTPLGRVAVEVPAEESALLAAGVTPGQAVARRVGARIEKTQDWLGQYAIWKYRLGAEYKALFSEKEGRIGVGTLQLFKAHRRLTKRSKIMAKERGLSVDDIQKEQGLALKGLSTDEAMNEAVKPIRKQIDLLQEELKIHFPDMEEMVDASVGEYLTRSYMSKIAPNIWEPSPELIKAAEGWFWKNYRKPVRSGDPMQAPESVATQSARASMFRAFNRIVADNTPDVTYAQNIVRSLRYETLGSVGANIDSIRTLVGTVKNPSKIRHIIVSGLERQGYSRKDAQGIVRILVGPEERLLTETMKKRLLALLTRQEIGTRKGQKIIITESDIIQQAKRRKVIGESIEQEARGRVGRKELRGGTIDPDVVKDVSSILGDLRGVFKKHAEEMVETRATKWTGAKVNKARQEFEAEMLEKFGPGPVSWRRLKRGFEEDTVVDGVKTTMRDEDFVAEEIQKLIGGTAESLSYRRARKNAQIPLGPTMKRKDIPSEIRALMGEIEEGPTAAAITIDNLTRLIAGKKFVDRFVKGADLISHPSYAGKTRVPWVKDGPAPGYTRMSPSEGWGPLRGKFVLNKYYNDLNDFGVSMSGKIQAWSPGAARAFEKGATLSQFAMTVFKVSKTVLNPATHARNILGNTVFADFADISVLNPLNWKHYRRAADELLKSGKGLAAEVRRRRSGLSGDEAMTDVVRSAIEHGAIHTEFMGGEILQELAINLVKHNGQFGRTMLQQMQRPIKAIGRLYNAEDQVFKLASFIKQTSQGATAREAAKHVNTWFPNYRDVSRFIKGARVSPVGAPFITFTAEATRIFSNAARQHPIKFVKWMILPQAFSAMSSAHLGLDEQSLKKLHGSLPKYLNQPFTVIWPFLDKNDNVQIVDGTYIHPLGAMFANQRHGAFDMPIIGDFLFNNPIINTGMEIAENTDFFTGKPIKRYGDISFEAYGKKILKDFLPPLTPFIGTGAKQIGRAIKGKPGRWGIKKSVLGAVKGELMPIRLTPVGPEIRRAGAYEKLGKLQDIQRDLRQVYIDMRREDISKAEGQAKIRRIKREIQRIRKQSR